MLIGYVLKYHYMLPMCIKCFTQFFSVHVLSHVRVDEGLGKVNQSQLKLSFFWKSHRTHFLSLQMEALVFLFFFCVFFTTFCTRTCVYIQHHTALISQLQSFQTQNIPLFNSQKNTQTSSVHKPHNLF